ncbi:hypothetical protein LIER_31842 [Lithospermum erythrorhizon]|uniref:AT-hook motif nuclear-localized protein n=1 Tax=Lithospermum erythrorhizon TaxID=34254 RepID=A0AAV3RSX2_LITER
MEERELMNNVGLIGQVGEALESYRVEPRNEAHNQTSGSEQGALPPVLTESVMPATPISVAGVGSEVKKKRGRPKKYGLYGLNAGTLSPTPISASIPLSGDYSGFQHNTTLPMEPPKKKKKLEYENPGDQLEYSVGGNFTPHLINVKTGEDVAMKILSFAQQGNRAICILASNGPISNVTLRQPNSSGGTLTYEGLFEILSLTGSFIPSDNGVSKSRSGGMSVSLVGPDGRVLGGGLAGMLVAAGPIQVIIGSFIPGQEQQQKPKKQKYELKAGYTPVLTKTESVERNKGMFGGSMQNMSSSASFHGDNMTTINFGDGAKISAPGNISFAGSDSTE